MAAPQGVQGQTRLRQPNPFGPWLRKRAFRAPERSVHNRQRSRCKSYPHPKKLCSVPRIYYASLKRVPWWWARGRRRGRQGGGSGTWKREPGKTPVGLGRPSSQPSTFPLSQNCLSTSLKSHRISRKLWSPPRMPGERTRPTRVQEEGRHPEGRGTGLERV